MLDFLIFSYFKAIKISCSAELIMKRSFITSRPGSALFANVLFYETPGLIVFKSSQSICQTMSSSLWPNFTVQK